MSTPNKCEHCDKNLVLESHGVVDGRERDVLACPDGHQRVFVMEWSTSFEVAGDTEGGSE